MNTELRNEALAEQGDDLVKMISMTPVSLRGIYDLCQRMPDHRAMYPAAVRALEVGLVSPNGYGQLVLTDLGRLRLNAAMMPKPERPER